MAMWWLFQEREDLLIESSRADSDFSGDPSENEEIELGVEGKGLKKNQLVAMTNYFWKNKRIPENLPQKLRTQASQVPERFEPTEETCPYCPGPTPPGLTEPVVVTKNASVYDIDSVKKGLYITLKNANICKYLCDNTTLICISLLSLLLKALQCVLETAQSAKHQSGFKNTLQDFINLKI